MITVYRVEHIAYRHGPYLPKGMTKRNRALSARMCDAATSLQPLPYYDGIKTVEGDYCGFESLASLIDWFIQWLDELEELDYHIAVFEVAEEDVKIGAKQIVFPRKKYRRSAALRMEDVRCEI